MAKAIRRNNTGKKAASFILGFFSCILLVIGCVAGLGIWAWYGVTLNKLENSFGFNTPLIQDNGAIKDQTLGQIIQTIMGYTDLSGKTLKDVKDDFSLDIPSTIEGKDNYSKDLDGLLEQLRLEDIVGIGDVISNAMEQPEFLAALVTGRDNPLAIIFEYFTIDDIEGLIGQELPQYGLLKNGDMNLAEVLIAISGATNMDKLSLEYIEDTLLDGDYIRYLTGVLSLLSDIRGMSVNEIIAGLEDGTLLDQIKVGTILDGANELLSEIINDKQFEEGDEAFINQSFIENYRELSIQDVIDDPLALADVNLGDLFRLAEKALGPEKTEAVAQRFDSLNLKELIDDPINTLEESNLTLGDLLNVVNIFAGEVDAEGNITGGVIPDSIVTIFDDFNIGAVLNGKFEEEMQHLVINDFMRAINDMAGSDVITDAVLDLFTQNGTEMTVYDLIKEGGFESFYRAVTVEQLLNIVNSYSNDMIDKSMFEGILHVTVGQIIDDPMNSLDFEAVPFLQGLDSLIAGTDSYEGTYIKAEVLELFKKEDGTSYTVGEIVDDIEGFGFGIRISDVLDVVEAYAGDIFVEPVENLVKDWTVGDMTEVDTYLDIYVRDLLEIAEYYLPGGLITEELYKALGDYQIRAFTDIDEFGQISLGDLFAVVNSYLDDPLIDLSRLTSSIRTYTEQLTIADIADDPYRAVLPVLGIASTFIFTDTIPYQVNSFFDSYTYAQYHVDPLGALLETKIKDAAVFLLEIAANFVDNPPLFETAQDAISELFGDATIYQAATDVLDTLNVGNILGTINVILDQEVITQEVKDAFDFTIREIIDDTDGVLDSITIEKLVYVLNSYTEYLAPELEHELIPLSGLESGVREDIATTSIKEIMDSPLNAVIPVLGAVSAYIFEGNIPTSVNDMFASIDYENYHADPAAELMNLQPAHVVQFINEVVYRYTGTAISDEALAVLAVIFDGVTMEDFTSVDRLLSALRVYNMMQAVNMVAGVDVFNDGWLRTFYTVTLYDLVFNGEDVLLALNLGNFIEIFNEYELGDIVLSGLPDEARTYVEQLSVNDIIGDPARLIAPVYLMAAGYIFKEDMPDSVTGVCGDIVFSGYHNDPVGGVYMVKMADLVNSVFDALRKYDIADIGDATDLFYNEDQDDPWVRVIDMFTVDTYKNMKIKEFFSFNGIPEKYLEAVELLVGDSTVGDCISGEVLKVITVGNILRSVNIIAEKQLISDSLCEIFDEFTIQGVIDDPMNALEIKVGPLLEAINETINPDKATIAPGIISLFGDYTIKDIIDDPMGFLRSLKVQDAVDAFNFYAPEKLDLKLEMYTMMSTLTVGKIMDYPAYIAPLVLAIAGNYLYEQDPPQSYVDLINEFDAEGSLADEALDIRVWNLIDVINETYEQFAGSSSDSDTFPIKQSVRNLFTAEDTLRVFTQKDFYFNTDLSQLVTIFYDYVTSLEFNQELYDLLDGVTVQSIMDGAYKDFLVTDIIKAITNFIPAEIPYLQPILSFVENWTIGSIMDGSCLKEVQVKAVLDLINEISPDLIKAEVYEVFGEATIWGLIQTDDLDLIYIDKILEAVNAYANGVIPTDFVEMFPYSIQDVIDDPMVLTDVRISAILDAINNIINKDKQTITQETIDVFGESTIRDIIDQKLDYVYDLKVADLLAAIASYIPSVNFDKSELDEFGMGDLTIRDLKDDPIQLAILGAGAVMYVVFGKIPDSVTDIYNKIKDEDDMLEAALDLPVTDLFAVVNECYQIKSGKTDDIIKQEVSEVFVKPDGTPLTFRDMAKADSYLDLQINNLIEAVEAYVSQVGEYVKPEIKALLEGWLIRDLYDLDKLQTIRLEQLFDIVNSYKDGLIKDSVYTAVGELSIADLTKVETYKNLLISDLLAIPNDYKAGLIKESIIELFDGWVVANLWDLDKLQTIRLEQLFNIANSYKDGLIKDSIYTAVGGLSIADLTKVETYKNLSLPALLSIPNDYKSGLIKESIIDLFDGWVVSDLWDLDKLQTIRLEQLFDIVESYKSGLIKDSVYTAVGELTIADLTKVETYKNLSLPALLAIPNDYKSGLIKESIIELFDGWVVANLWDLDKLQTITLGQLFNIANSYKDGLIKDSIYTAVGELSIADLTKVETYKNLSLPALLAIPNDYKSGLIKESIIELFDGWVVANLWDLDKLQTIRLEQLFNIANSYKDGLIKDSVYTAFGELSIADLTKVNTYKNILINDLFSIVNDYKSGLIKQEFFNLFDGWMISDLWNVEKMKTIQLSQIFDIINSYEIQGFEGGLIKDSVYTAFGDWTGAELIELDSYKNIVINDLFAIANDYKDGLIKQEVLDVFGASTIGGLISGDDLDLIYIDKILEAVNAYANGVIPNDFVEMFPYSIQDVIDDPLVLTEVRISAILDAINNIINKDKQTITQETIDVFGESTIRDIIDQKLDYVYDLKVADLLAAIASYIPSVNFDKSELDEFGMGDLTIRDLKDDPIQLAILGAGAVMYVVFGKIPDSVTDIYNKIKDEDDMLEAALDLPVTDLFAVVNECYQIKSGKTDDIIKQEVSEVFVKPDGTPLTFRDMAKADSYLDLQINNLIEAVEAYVSQVGEYVKPEVKALLEGWLIRDLYSLDKWKSIELSELFDIVNSYKADLIKTEVYNAFGSKTIGDMIKVETYKQLMINDLLPIINAYANKEIITDEIKAVFEDWMVSDLWNVEKLKSIEINKLIDIANSYKSDLIKDSISTLFEDWVISDLWNVEKLKSIELSKLFDIVNSYKDGLIKAEVYTAFGSKTIGDMIKVETYKQLMINDLLPIINAYANKEIITDEIKAVFEDWMVSDLWNVEKLKSIELSKLFNIVNSYKADLIKTEVYTAFGSKTIGDMIKVETYKQLMINDLLPIINAYANKEIITDEIKAVFEDWMVSDLWNVEKLKSIELSKLFDIVNSYKADLIKNSIYEAIGGNTIGQMLELETYKAITLNSLMNIVYDYTKLEENQLITDFLSDVTIGDLANADTYDRFLLSDALRIVNSYKDVIPEEIIDIVSGVTFKDFAYPKTLLSKIQVVPVLAFANDKLNLGFDRDKMDTALGTLTFYDFIFKIHTTCKTINLTAALDLLVDRWAPVELIQTFTEDSVYDLYTTPKDVLGKIVVADVFKFSFIPTNIQEGMEIALCGIKVSDCIEYKTLADKLYLGKIAEGLDKAIGGKYVIATDELIALCREYTVYDLYKNYKQIAQETMLTEVVGVINSYFKDVEMDISNVDYIKDLTVYDLIEKPQYLIVLGAYCGLYFWYDGEIPEVYFELANEFADGGVWAITVNSTLAVGEELFHKISGKDTDIIKDEVYALFEGWTYESFKSTDALKNLEIPALFDAVNAYKENLIHSEVSDVFTLADGSAMTIGDLLTTETRNQIVINNALKAVESYLKSDYIKDSVYTLLDGVTLGNVTDKDTYLDMMVWDIYKVAEEYIVGDKTDGVYGRIMSEEFQSALSDLIGTWTVRDLKYKNTYREIKLNTLFDLVNIAADKDLIKDEVCTVFEGWTLEMLKDVESWKALEIPAILDAVNAYKENLIHSEVGGIFVLADGSAMTIGDLLTAEGRNQIVVNNVFTAVESYLEKDYIKDSVYNLFEGVTLETLVKADTYLDMMVWDIYKVAEEYIVGDKTDGVYGRIMSEQFQSTLNDIIGTWRVRDLKYKNTYWEISVGSMFDLVNFALDKFIFKQSVIDLFEDWTLKDLTDTSKLKELKVNNLYLVAADYKSNLPSAISNYLFNEQTQDAFVKLFEDKRLVDLKDKEVYKSMLVNDVFDLINGVLSPKFDAFLGEAFYELGRTTEEDGTVRELTVAELFTKDGLLDLELGTLADAGLQMIANFGKNYALNEDIRSMLDGMTVRELISNKMNFVVIGGTVALLIYFEGDIPDSVMNFINKLDVGASDFKTLLADITVEDTIEMIKGFGYYPAFLPLDVYDVIKPCRIVGIVEDPIGELGMLTLSDLAKFSFIPELFQDILSGENIGKVTLAEIKESKAAAFKDVTVGEITDHITALPEVVRDIVRNMNLGNCFLENGLVNEIKAVKLADFVKPGELFNKLGTELIDFLADPERALTIGDLIDNPAKALGDISLKTLFSMLGTFDESFMNAIADITLTDFLDKKLEVFYDIKIGNLFDLGDDAVAKVVADMTINDIRGGELSNKRIGEFLDVIETIDPVTGEITYRAGTSDTIKAIGHLNLTEIQNGALDDVRIAVFLGVGTVNADGTIDYAEGTSPFITAIGHLTLGSITEGDNLKDAINSIALKDIFTGDDLPKVLQSLRYEHDGTTPVTLATLSERIKNLTVKDVFGEKSERTGVLKALGDDVMIDNLMVELTKAMFGEKSGEITVTTFSGKEGAISISAAAVDREYLISDLDEATLTAIGAALGTTVDATTYYKVKVSAKTDSSVTLVATTKGSVKMVDVMEGSGETYHGDEKLYVQELIYKMNQKPTIDGEEIQKPGATDDTYESWWDLIMEQAA